MIAGLLHVKNSIYSSKDSTRINNESSFGGDDTEIKVQMLIERGIAKLKVYQFFILVRNEWIMRPSSMLIFLDSIASYRSAD